MRRRVADMTDLIRVLWNSRMSITAATLVAGVVAAGISLVLPKSYQASAHLMITEARIASSAGNAGLSSFFNPRLYTTFEGYITRSSVLRETLDRFPEFTEREWAVEDLATNVSVGLIPNTRRIRVGVTLFDPQMAADVANHIAQQAEEYTRTELYANEAEAVRDRLTPELVRAQAEFDAAETGLAAAHANGSAQSLQSHLDGLVRQRDHLLGLRAPVQNLINTHVSDQAMDEPLRERYLRIMDERSAYLAENSPCDLEEQRMSLWSQRSILREAIVEAESSESRLIGGLDALDDLSDEELDIYLSSERVRAREQLGGLRSQMDAERDLLTGVEASGELIDDQYIYAAAENERLTNALVLAREEYKLLYAESTQVLMMRLQDYDQQLAQVEASAEQVRSLIGEVITSVAVAEAQMDIAEAALSSIQSTHSEAALRLEERHQGLTVMDEAFAPTYPVAPRKKLLTILAAGLAFVCACVVVIARENILAATEESPST